MTSEKHNAAQTLEKAGPSKKTRFPYYPGCTLKTTAQNLEASALASAEVLGIELVELPRWNCCGVVSSLADDDLIHHVAPVRNLIRAQEMRAAGVVDGETRLVTLCSMCFNTLKRSNARVKESADDLKTINEFMYLEDDYDGGVDVVHFLEVLRDVGHERISEAVKAPLAGLKVAPYYGCTLLRPKEIGIDDPEAPTIQDDLLRALGAEPVDNPYKKVCCGSYQIVQNRDAVADLAYDILRHARIAGAEAMTTCCPLCAFNLDRSQREIGEKHPDHEPMPVLYITQLMALAFGLPPECMRFDLNYTNPKALLLSTSLAGEEA